VLIDTALLILGDSFYFIRFFFRRFCERSPRIGETAAIVR